MIPESPAILLINGPNLNMLGRREKEHYGSFTLDDVEDLVRLKALNSGFRILSFQSNHEGELLDFIQLHLDDAAGCLINAGAFTHYSYALLDALKLCPYPVIEVHISDIESREEFRRHSVIRPACAGVVSGLGLQSYTRALDMLITMLTTNRITDQTSAEGKDSETSSVDESTVDKSTTSS